MTKAYVVKTENDEEGRTVKILGYATGNIDHIRAYFEDRKYYNIYIDEIEIKEITPSLVTNKSQLLARKKAIEQELKTINAQL